MAQEALKGGMLERGMELLKGIDETTITDPNVYFNVAVLFLNQQKAEQAIPYLTKAVALDPSYVDGYFQRALAYLQLQKLAESKADFRRVLELQPEGPQAETAKKALEQLK
jgi:tetratricopeptide (TPR) repeat protein